MNKVLLIILLLIINSSVISFAQAITQEKLVFAIDVIRHGDRTPTKEFPNDPHTWPQGLGELTPLGMRQEYQLGTSFRQLYVNESHLLPAHFDINTMQVFSDNYNRTMQSALSLLYGLYPLGSGPKVANHFALPKGYQPIPVFSTMKFDKDSISKSALKTYKQLLRQKVFASDQWQQQQRQWQNQFKRISAATGFKVDKLEQLNTIGQNLFIRNIYHVAYPAGISTTEANQLISLSQQLSAEIYAHHSIGELVSAQLLNIIKHYLLNASQKNLPLKYVLFSAHDTTILALMSALNVSLDRNPHYASDVKILLYKNVQNNYFVKIFYNNKMLELPFCGNKLQCPLDKVLVMV